MAKNGKEAVGGKPPKSEAAARIKEIDEHLKKLGDPAEARKSLGKKKLEMHKSHEEQREKMKKEEGELDAQIGASRASEEKVVDQIASLHREKAELLKTVNG